MNSDLIAILPLEARHLPCLVDVVRLNNPDLGDLMRSDVDSWFARGCPKGEEYFTAMDSDRAVGMTGFKPDVWGNADISWLVWLYIHPDYKRRGIAGLLFGHAQRRMREQGCRKAYLDVGNADEHVSGIAFHERDGFRLEGHLKNYWKPGEDFLIFGKDLV